MAKKYLGQHFLFDPSILRRIILAAGLVPDDTVVEIGPGHGRMTRILADNVRRVIAVELDGELAAILREDFAGSGSVEVVHGDALLYPYHLLGSFKVVANIPYYITTPLLFRLLEYKGCLQSATLTLQKEVAERVVAQPGGKAYGVLSIAVQYYADAKLRFIVPRGAFRPVPKVDSAVIHLEVLERPVIEVLDESTFFRVVKTAFSQRRKMLVNALKPLSADIREILVRAGIDPSRRAETLSIGDFGRLSDMLCKNRREKTPERFP